MHALLKAHDEILSVQPRTRRLTRWQARAFRQQLAQATETSSCLLLDLSQVDYIDSVGFRIILDALQGARARGGDIKLVAPRPPVRTLLELTRLYRVFDLHEEAAPAVDAFHQRRNHTALFERIAQ